MFIHEDSMIDVLVGGNIICECEVNKDINISGQTLLLVNGTPIHIEKVQQVDEGKFELHGYWQDCLSIKDEILYEHYSESID